jgi:hypothetical protein
LGVDDGVIEPVSAVATVNEVALQLVVDAVLE